MITIHSKSKTNQDSSYEKIDFDKFKKIIIKKSGNGCVVKIVFGFLSCKKYCFPTVWEAYKFVDELFKGNDKIDYEY